MSCNILHATSADVKKIDAKVTEVRMTMMGHRYNDDNESYNCLFWRCDNETLEVVLILLFERCRLSSIRDLCELQQSELSALISRSAFDDHWM